MVVEDIGRFDVLKSKKSLSDRVKTLGISVVILGGALALVWFFASERLLVAQLQGRGSLARAAALGLGARGAPAGPVRNALLDALPNEGGAKDPAVRAACAWALGRTHTREMVFPLEAAARRDPALEVRVAAVRAIGANADRAGTKVVFDALTDPEPSIREAACWASRDLADPELADPCMNLLRDARFEIRNAAAKALTAMSGGMDHGTDEYEWRKNFRPR